MDQIQENLNVVKKESFFASLEGTLLALTIQSGVTGFFVGAAIHDITQGKPYSALVPSLFAGGCGLWAYKHAKDISNNYSRTE